EPVNTIYKVGAAKVILSLDADFLCSGPGSVRYQREFADARRGEEMCRLYAVESTPTNTGAKADHRFPMRASEVRDFALDLARQLGAAPAGTPSAGKAPAALAADLKSHAGASLVIAGDGQPPFVHAVAHAINQALGNKGKTVIYTETLDVQG